MTTVKNTVTKADGVPRESVEVTIALSWDKTLGASIRDPQTDTSYYGVTVTETDGRGLWTVQLVGNDVLVPAGSLYKVTESKDSETPVVYYISVVNGASDTWVGDVTVDTPSWEA